MAITAKKFLHSLAPQSLYPDPVSPWHLLANGIIERAVKDYRKAQKKHYRLVRRIARAAVAGKKPTDEEKWAVNIAKQELRELECFFRSDWFETLSEIDGEYLIARLKEEVAI